MIWPFGWKSNEVSAEPPKLDPATILRRARRLRFRVRPGAVSALAGVYHSARPGIGLMFAELRAYEPGDDVRHLDWNVTARQGRPYVRRFVEERALTLWLILDVSASLRFGIEGQTKADRAAQAATLLASAAVANGDRVRLTLVSDRVEAEVPSGSGNRHLARIVRALVATPTVSRGTDPAVALRQVRQGPRRALVILFSDFLASAAEPFPSSTWRRTARANEFLAIRPVDPREEQLPVAGLVALKDAESGARLTVDSGSSRVRAAYEQAANERRAAFRRWCSQVGAEGYDLPTAADPIGTLIRIFDGRSSRRGRGPS